MSFIVKTSTPNTARAGIPKELHEHVSEIERAFTTNAAGLGVYKQQACEYVGE